MTSGGELTRTARLGLAALAAVGFLGVNGVFVYGAVIRPAWMTEALGNPFAAAFIAEALILVGLFAWLFRRFGVTRLHGGGFVVLSLLGSQLFSIPVALLMPAGRENSRLIVKPGPFST